MGMLKIFSIIFIVFVSGCATQVNTPTTDVTQYSIGITSYPLSANANEEFTIAWRVDSQPLTTLAHTAIHYSTQSHPGDYGSDTSLTESGYESVAGVFTPGNFTMPDTFSARIKTPEGGKLFFRAHAIIDGKNYWTQEYSIGIKQTVPAGTLEGVVTPPSVTTPEPSVKEYSMEADDAGFYINGQTVSSLTVNKSETVKITFAVRETNTYVSGLDFRGCGQQNGAGRGGSASIQFSTESACTITSYWPTTGVVKSHLDVFVS